MPETDYECTLSEASLKKAQDELHEEPMERLGAVEALRQWVNDQPHIVFPTGKSITWLTHNQIM